MWLKRIVATVLSAVCLFTCISTVASAKVTETFSFVSGVSPLYEIASNTYVDLTITGSSAVCSSTVQQSNAVKITAEQYLQKHVFLWIWNTYDGAEWTKTVNDNSIRFTNTKTGLSSGKYRLKTIFTLTDKNGKTETITVYSDVKSVG